MTQERAGFGVKDPLAGVRAVLRDGGAVADGRRPGERDGGVAGILRLSSSSEVEPTAQRNPDSAGGRGLRLSSLVNST